MKLLKEMYHREDEQSTTYDRAIDMINAAVEQHRDDFDSIADVDSLVDYLRGRYQDFDQSLEQNIRDIIADETGHDEDPEEDLAQYKDNYNKGLIPDEEQEEFRGGGKYGASQRDEFRGGGKFKRRQSPNYFSNKENKKYKGTLSKAARMIPAKKEEEETRLIPKGLVDRRPQKDDTQSILDNNERRKQERRHSLSGPSKRARRSLRNRRQQTASHNPFSVGFEQEEAKDKDYVDWDKEVSEFRKRRKAYEPEHARRGGSNKLRRRRSSDSGVFNVRFESFKQFNERVK